MVCKPKKKGGLGVIDLQLWNKALLMKILHKFYNNHDLPRVKLIRCCYYNNGVPHAVNKCGSFWWRDVMSFVTDFRGISAASLGSGQTLLFWKDLWNGFLFYHKYPRLFSFAKDQDISVHDYLHNEDITGIFNVPLTHQASQECDSMQLDLEEVSINPDTSNSWNYIWGNSHYSSSRFYAHCFYAINSPKSFSWIRKSKCLAKLNVFAWLLLSDRLNT